MTIHETEKRVDSLEARVAVLEAQVQQLAGRR
jgi:tetrahydromethanopterin S-methyltransferase subunit G